MTTEEFEEYLEQLKAFLIKRGAESYWNYTTVDKLRASHHPFGWISHMFTWSRTTEKYGYWDRIHTHWDQHLLGPSIRKLGVLNEN